MTWQSLLDAWVGDDDFSTLFTRSLIETGPVAAFWETPVLRRSTLERPFECVLVPASPLAHLKADARPFAQALAADPGEVIVFGNLGGDADLVVPRRLTEASDPAHLLAFLRSAAPRQGREIWRLAAQRARGWLEADRPCWISTSGLGVTWLHVRLDRRPKYYSHAPYRNAAGLQSR